jgi:hypothetical protein
MLDACRIMGSSGGISGVFPIRVSANWLLLYMFFVSINDLYMLLINSVVTLPTISFYILDYLLVQ